MYRSFTPELFWSNTSVVVSLFLESVSSSVNTLLLTCYSLSNSLLPSYEDLGPFFTVLAPFGFICFPF